jgi:sn-glycerol 3-phosphate transport system ATP-binding protein
MTVLYVTHDQVEAMSMADKIVLIREGRIEQEGSPEELYARPATMFAARFIGTPAMNLVALGSVQPGRGKELTLGVRPEHLRLAPGEGVQATVTSAEYHGADSIVTVRVGEETLFVRAPGQLALAAGAQVRLAWEPRDAHLFDSRSGLRIDAEQALRDAPVQQRKVG